MMARPIVLHVMNCRPNNVLRNEDPYPNPSCEGEEIIGDGDKVGVLGGERLLGVRASLCRGNAVGGFEMSV